MLIFGSSAERNYQSGMEGMVIGRVLLFISFEFQDAGYACALSTGWYRWVSGQTRIQGCGLSALSMTDLFVVALQSSPLAIPRGAHLLPVYGSALLPENFHFSQSLNAFHSYYVNKFVDHHAHEFIS